MGHYIYIYIMRFSRANRRDGCIHLPKNARDKNNKIMSPVITLTFNAKDLPLIVMLQERLGVGHIYKNKGSNAYTYRILNYKNLALLIPPSLCFFFVLLLSFVKLKIKKKKDGAPYIYIYIYTWGYKWLYEKTKNQSIK